MFLSPQETLCAVGTDRKLPYAGHLILFKGYSVMISPLDARSISFMREVWKVNHQITNHICKDLFHFVATTSVFRLYSAAPLAAVHGADASHQTLHNCFSCTCIISLRGFADYRGRAEVWKQFCVQRDMFAYTGFGRSFLWSVNSCGWLSTLTHEPHVSR